MCVCVWKGGCVCVCGWAGGWEDVHLCSFHVGGSEAPCSPHPARHPARHQVTSLGNVVLLYGALPEGDPNRTMIALRQGVEGSLIEVVYK